MSRQAVTAFYAKVGTDQALQQAIAGLTPRDVDGLIKIASGAGFEFNAQDYLAVSDANLNAGNELSESDLSAVAGGMRPSKPRTPVASSMPTNDSLWCC
jgi:predicted ribosomally synthesized peptide with nif11-like leader